MGTRIGLPFNNYKTHIFADMKISKPLCGSAITYMGYPIKYALQQDKNYGTIPEGFCRKCVKAMRQLSN